MQYVFLRTTGACVHAERMLAVKMYKQTMNRTLRLLHTRVCICENTTVGQLMRAADVHSYWNRMAKP